MPERLQDVPVHPGGTALNVTDAWHLSRCLRHSGDRRRCGAGEQGEELPPPHSMTSSARAKTTGGMVMPSAFAVLRLMTSSNLVGNSTGKSPGLLPFKILSTYAAARRELSRRLIP